ncbi:BPTI/Kunitz domain-containing protein-like [Daphnia pulicaria]|uniref:BPTI/Kunitz domain-containing protein-like n=1 Tax=Daphnia pulicaria TaxID=35523 RepID=UPI001EEA927F|nr:BPTI/Kunitz domain-containing protein-like [Daphnia pulicaria]
MKTSFAMFSLFLVMSLMLVTSQAAQFDDVCSLKRESVKCRTLLPTWYFDKATGTCYSFNIGECSSNFNSFGTKKMCEKRCATPANVCTLKKDSGMCRAAVTAWYFDPPTDSRNKGECKNFIYGGCGGNANRFASKKKCDDMCAYLPFGASK